MASYKGTYLKGTKYTSWNYALLQLNYKKYALYQIDCFKIPNFK